MQSFFIDLSNCHQRYFKQSKLHYTSINHIVNNVSILIGRTFAVIYNLMTRLIKCSIYWAIMNLAINRDESLNWTILDKATLTSKKSPHTDS